MNGASLLMSLLVSSAGYVSFAYGKRQRRAPQLAIGLVLMLFPYLVEEPWTMLLIALGLLLLLWLLVKMGA